MNGVQNRKVHNIEKPLPGCLGRMVNLFDITAGVTRNKLLTDKPHRDASTLSRSRLEGTRMLSPPPPYTNQFEDKKVHQTTPMKMLIDQEMTREMHVNHNPLSVVAKLMGLDTFPGSHPTRSNSTYYSGRFGHANSPPRCWQRSDGFVENETILDNVSEFAEHDNCRDIYETWQQSPKSSNVINKSPKKGRYSGDINRKKMDLVRQKFDEVKHLSTDDKLNQSKEFEDALEVLSSNHDLLLEILQESNPKFYQNLFDLKSTAHPETKRITVLRPTKTVDDEKSYRSGKMHFQHQKLDALPLQPTRIVVLKPSPDRTSDLRAGASSTPSSGILPTEGIPKGPEDGIISDPQQAAKEITQKMRENLVACGKTETLYSSMFCNGYSGGDNSFDTSENGYPVGNLSDLEVTTLSPRHSWDYVNRCGSPYSSPSFSRASCSSDSSVRREAKKRLSERWTLMASNGSSQEQKLGRRSSSTLGEMLALSEIKKPVIFEDVGIHKEQGSGESISRSSSNIDEGGFPKTLPRSKSLPVSSNTFGSKLDVQVSNHEISKAQAPQEELTKARSMKSLKGKVSSLFFSRNRKTNKEKARVSQSNDESQLGTKTPASVANVPGILSNEASASFEDNEASQDVERQEGMASDEPGLSVAKPVITVLSENQDQPSPISVLDPPFEEDENAAMESLAMIKPGQLGPSILSKSNLIDKSPPIGSIARTLSWESSCAEVATTYPARPSTVAVDIRDEEDWLSCVHTLLSLAGLDEQMPSDAFISRWHSPQSALDSSLRDEFANSNCDGPLQEAKRRQKQSKQKLVFDCLNAVLEEITGYGSEWHPTSRTCCGGVSVQPEGTTPMLVDLVVGRMKELLSSEWSCVLEDYDDESQCLDLVVESSVRKEIVGRGWVDLMRMEMDSFGMEMEGKLLEELVKEAVDDLTHTV